jgi:phosphoglycerol transferase MdoB-like AlkP superfamily enzyme
VQLFDWGWDHHGSSPGESIDETLPIKCQQLDKAVSGLLTDLKQRGLLDSTLVVLGGEFGRTPMSQNNVRETPTKGFFGRDHHPHAYSMMLAGGGVYGGMSYGQSDEIGYYVAEDPVTPKDLQATILHLLGLDPYRFGYEYQGLFNRLIGPTDEGKVLTKLLV